MLQETYFNNAGFALAGGISAADTVISSAITMPQAGLIEGGGRFNLTSFARATLVNPDQRDAMEIVFIVRINELEKTVDVLRGQEGTTALAWNEGTRLECRITAGMLNVARARSAFSPDTGALSINFGNNMRVFSFAAGSPTGQNLIANSWGIGGAPVLAQAGADEAGAYTGAQAERARVAIAQAQAKIAAKELEWSGWKAKLSAEVAKMDAAAKQSAILVDGYRVSAHAIEAKAASYMRRWEADIKQYEAGSNISLQTARINTDLAIQTNNARLEAGKIGLTTAAQRVASAWSMVSTSAAISGSVSQSV